jgi:putative pyruvate formate lyase activating enzyme
MPSGVAEAQANVDFLVAEIAVDMYLNIMGQYRPEYRAWEVSGIGRRPTNGEIDEVIAHARSRGMHRIEV